MNTQTLLIHKTHAVPMLALCEQAGWQFSGLEWNWEGAELVARS